MPGKGVDGSRDLEDETCAGRSQHRAGLRPFCLALHAQHSTHNVDVLCVPTETAIAAAIARAELISGRWLRTAESGAALKFRRGPDGRRVVAPVSRHSEYVHDRSRHCFRCLGTARERARRGPSVADRSSSTPSGAAEPSVSRPAPFGCSLVAVDIGAPSMTAALPEISPETVAEWQCVVDLAAGLLLTVAPCRG